MNDTASPTIPWTLEIHPEEHLPHIDFAELWRYRNLCQGAIDYA